MKCPADKAGDRCSRRVATPGCIDRLAPASRELAAAKRTLQFAATDKDF